MALFGISQRLRGREYTPPVLTLDTPPVYPSVWMAEHPNMKPAISVFQTTPAHLYGDLLAIIDESTWDDTTVVSFMVEVIRENPEVFQVVSTTPWNANGRVISRANQPITPLDILTINPIRYPNEYEPEVVSRETRLSLFYGLLLIYRKTATRNINEQYGISTGRRLDAFFKANKLDMTQEDSERLAGYLGNEKMTEGYLKMIAAIDMFFFHFPNAEYSKIRMATLPSRYKGCAALTSLGQISRMTGMTPAALGLFVYTEPVALEIAQISKPNEGADDVDSYFPYQIDFGLTPKSPYSLSSNPTLYLWLHTIGCVLAYSRSINAKYPSQATDVTGTTVSAAAVALNLSRGMNLNKQFATSLEAALEFANRIDRAQAPPEEDPDDEGANRDDMEEEEDEDQFVPLPPADQDPIAIRSDKVLRELIDKGGLSRDDLIILRKRLTNARTALPDTIGKYLANLYTGN